MDKINNDQIALIRLDVTVFVIVGVKGHRGLTGTSYFLKREKLLHLNFPR